MSLFPSGQSVHTQTQHTVIVYGPVHHWDTVQHKQWLNLEDGPDKKECVKVSGGCLLTQNVRIFLFAVTFNTACSL